ncbi:MAG: TolC family protein [Bryobacteraceae bacterium]|jgi:outer membrane protein
MQKRSLLTVAFLAISPMMRQAMAQAPRRLTLSEAQQFALRNHPRIDSAKLVAQAAKSGITEVRAPMYPMLSGNFTSVGAEHNSTLSAGTVQTSSLYSRVAAGVTVRQLITDFGRTSNLVESAKLRASAQEQIVGNTQAGILIEVDQAYYQALAADSVLRVAQAVVDNRRLTLRQVQALAQSSLKSTLDVSFAEVAVSDAELGLVRAENDAQASRARLADALGATATEQFELADEPLPPPLAPDPETVVAEALSQRPDLAALKLSRDAADRFARAEKALRRPTISALGVAGGLPATDPRLHDTYSAAGVNINVPILNGKLYAARENETELRAQAADKDVQDLTVQVSEQVRTAWLEANTAFRRLDVTARLVEQAERSLRLAQIRYDNGLGSIVELNQAQLSQVSAEITAAGAKYDYLSRRAALAFVTGALR